MRTITRGGTNQPLAVLLRRLNPVLRGWTNYFRHGVSKRDLQLPRRLHLAPGDRWLRHKHRRATWKQLRRRYLPGWWPTDGEITLFNPQSIAVTRYRYRGTQIPTPWTTSGGNRRIAQRPGLVESRMRGNTHVRFGECGPGKRTGRKADTAPRPDPYHVRWVTHDGPTELSNLVLLCQRHHHRLHLPEWRAKLLPDSTFEVTGPDGLLRCTSPPRAEPGWGSA